MAEKPDPRTVAALAFARLRTNPAVQRAYPWLRHTVVCLETDLVSEVQERMLHLVPEGGGGSVACYFPQQKMFVFTPVGVSVDPEPPDELPGLRTLFTSDDVPHDNMTMAQAFETADMLSGRSSHLVGRESTTKIEAELALS